MAWVTATITVYTISKPSGFRDHIIVHLQMVNVLVALELWGSLWANKIIRIHCNNDAVVDVLSTSRARDEILGIYVHNVWLLQPCLIYLFMLSIFKVSKIMLLNYHPEGM